MRTKEVRSTIPLTFAVLLIAGSMAAYAQEGSPQPVTQQQMNESTPEIVHVANGQEENVQGLIVKRDANTFTMEDSRGKFYVVSFTNATEIVERKSNPFRGAKVYNSSDLMRGLSVEVQGRGDSSGQIQAGKIRLRNDDLRIAESLQAGINPVETELRKAESRLAQAEQDQQRLSGQVQELTEISSAARSGAKAAQETADSALKSAQEAKIQIRQTDEKTNERISSLDDYEVSDNVTVNFRAASATLSKDAKASLDRLAENAKAEKGYLIEVMGYASSDGNEAFNQRLSQHRADAVIQYLAENYNIPVRRFVTPLGYGEKQPVADNGTHAGRVQNRRVEVRILVNKGLVQPVNSGSQSEASQSSPIAAKGPNSN